MLRFLNLFSLKTPILGSVELRSDESIITVCEKKNTMIIN